MLTAVRGLTAHVQRPAVLRALIALRDDAASQHRPGRIAEQIQFALRNAADTRQLSDAEWQQALASDQGDAAAGRRVFYDNRTACSKCHEIDGRGGWIGPALTNISAAKTDEQILQSILLPSLDVAPDYQGYYVLMQNGRVHQGVQFHYRGESVELQLESGELIKFALSDAQEYGPLKDSLMPANLAQTMSLVELRDLLAFLDTLGKDR